MEHWAGTLTIADVIHFKLEDNIKSVPYGYVLHLFSMAHENMRTHVLYLAFKKSPIKHKSDFFYS